METQTFRAAAIRISRALAWFERLLKPRLPVFSGLVADRIADFTRRDVLLAYDFRRYQPETIALCQAAKQRGVKLVLFTDLDLSPIADIADVVIPVAVECTSPLETLAVAIDQSVVTALASWGVRLTPQDWGYTLWELKISQVAPILPYLFLVLMIIFRPRGLLGTREG